MNEVFQSKWLTQSRPINFFFYENIGNVGVSSVFEAHPDCIVNPSCGSGGRAACPMTGRLAVRILHPGLLFNLWAGHPLKFHPLNSASHPLVGECVSEWGNETPLTIYH